MQTSFVVQPFLDGTDLRDFLATVVQDHEIDNLRVAVAWAKRSGLARVQSELQTFRDRGGKLTLIVGISEGGATAQGLEMALALSDSAYVFYDPSGRTFHPKVYFGSGPTSSYLLVGSHNLTAGGLYFNYEAGISCGLNLLDGVDREVADSVILYFDRLISDRQVCVPLNSASLREILTNPEYRIGDEDQVRVTRSAGIANDVPENVDGAQGAHGISEIQPVFGTSIYRKRGGPTLAGLAAQSGSSPISSVSGVSPPSVPAEKRWLKELTGSDAQVAATANTKRTGNLKLTKAKHPIDQASYFRHDFFGLATWATIPTARGAREEAVVPVSAFIGDQSLGVLNLIVDHADYRVANQNNAPTWLHWGPELTDELRSHDYKGDFITLERFPDGSYRLTIGPAGTGDFIV